MCVYVHVWVQISEAIRLCETKHVIVTEDLAEQMTLPKKNEGISCTDSSILSMHRACINVMGLPSCTLPQAVVLHVVGWKTMAYPSLPKSSSLNTNFIRQINSRINLVYDDKWIVLRTAVQTNLVLPC